MSERTNKNSMRHTTNVQQQRIEDDDDFEVVKARTSSLHGPGGLPLDSAKSPLKGRTTWTEMDSWEPEDSTELDLDPDSAWFEEEMEAGFDKILPSETNAHEGLKVKRKKKSQASVSDKYSTKLAFMLTSHRHGQMFFGRSDSARVTWMRCCARTAEGISCMISSAPTALRGVQRTLSPRSIAVRTVLLQT